MITALCALLRVVMQTMLKDEAGALVEWIEYHVLLGVEHFYVYDNNSGDDVRRRLQRYRRAEDASHYACVQCHSFGWGFDQHTTAGLVHHSQCHGMGTGWVQSVVGLG